MALSCNMDMKMASFRTHWKYDHEMDKQRYPAQKLRLFQVQRLSFDSQVENSTLRDGTKVNHSEPFKQKAHSFDLEFFRAWRRDSIPLQKYQSKSRKKLSRQCRSLEGVIPEEDIVIDRPQSRQKLQPQRRSLDLFELPSALRKIGRSLREKR